MDVYLYNDGSKATKVRTLEYLSAEWLLDNTTGTHLGGAGGSEKISVHGYPSMLIPAGAILHRMIDLDVRAKAGDLVTVKVSLKGPQKIQSNAVLLYCSPRNNR